MKLMCDGPGPHDPEDGVLGECEFPIDGMRCASPACDPQHPDKVSTPDAQDAPDDE